MFAPKRILVPTDFSDYSDKALLQAVDVAKKFNARIDLLHVIDEGLQQCAADYCLSPDVMKQIDKESRKTSEEKLNEASTRISASPEIELEKAVRKGNPADEILKEQKEKKIDLIVMASHGRSGIMKYLIGSVADKVMRSAGCAVLLVRAK